ncbi:MAG TPA: alpha/beta fold hydrolase [Candidatus Acidoferrales bacterium]|nr:alpha/beta fold hydrolase [Candidatus Acidoferrales bacterium]
MSFNPPTAASPSVAADVYGEGPAVTLLHGFSQGRASWREMAQMLSGRHRYILPDLPGHGLASHQAASMAAAAAEIVRLWDQLGIDRSHLVGYSLGGRLALHLASFHPQRILSLMTIGAHAGIADRAARQRRLQTDGELAQQIRERGLEWFSDYWASLPLFQGLARRGPDFIDQARAWRLQHSAEGLAASLEGMGAGAMEPLWDRLSAIAVPTTLLAGMEDPAYSARAGALAERITGARVELIPQAGHAAHLEQPGSVARVLDWHLNQSSIR